MGSIRAGFGIGVLALSTAVPAIADWSVYVAPGLGISGADLNTNGQVSVGGGGPISIGARDSDASPLLDLAVGLEIPMDEIVPREWLLNVRLPDWPMRFEVETAGLREYEFRTVAVQEDFFTEYKVTATLFFNAWTDIPMTAIYRPIQYTLGLGRQPRVRRWLEPASFYFGAGIGMAALDIDGTSNAVFGDDDPIDFAWNVGAGFNYALSERLALSVGYRYVGLGEQKVRLGGGNGGANDEIEFEPHVHELRASIRIRVYEFLSPWR